MGRSRRSLSLCRKPSVNAVPKSASGAVIGNLLTVGEAKPVAQDKGVSQPQVLLSTRALTDTVPRLQAEGTSLGPGSPGAEGRIEGELRDERRIGCDWPRLPGR
jgi:hypothetical protein